MLGVPLGKRAGQDSRTASGSSWVASCARRTAREVVGPCRRRSRSRQSLGAGKDEADKTKVCNREALGAGGGVSGAHSEVKRDHSTRSGTAETRCANMTRGRAEGTWEEKGSAGHVATQRAPSNGRARTGVPCMQRPKDSSGLTEWPAAGGHGARGGRRSGRVQQRDGQVEVEVTLLELWAEQDLGAEDDPQGHGDGQLMEPGSPRTMPLARGKSFNKASCISAGPPSGGYLHLIWAPCLVREQVPAGQSDGWRTRAENDDDDDDSQPCSNLKWCLHCIPFRTARSSEGDPKQADQSMP